MDKYRFTIVTVCYNAENYIANTILSLIKQDYNNYEYIIKDGGSTDKTMSIIHSLLDENDKVHIVAEKDNGIYDAMNHAVKMAQGEYIYFLNAGDCFYNEKVLVNADQIIESQNCDAFFGNIVQVNDTGKRIRKYGRICGSKFYFLTGDCVCHQALFVKRKLFEGKMFDTSFQVCADKEWQMYHLISQKANFCTVPFIIANVLTDGFSKNHVSILESETQKCLEKYYPHMAWIYKMILNIKKNYLILQLLRDIESVFFTDGMVDE